jgi:hypothetical protein
MLRPFLKPVKSGIPEPVSAIFSKANCNWIAASHTGRNRKNVTLQALRMNTQQCRFTDATSPITLARSRFFIFSDLSADSQLVRAVNVFANGVGRSRFRGHRGYHEGQRIITVRRAVFPDDNGIGFLCASGGRFWTRRARVLNEVWAV